MKKKVVVKQPVVKTETKYTVTDKIEEQKFGPLLDKENLKYAAVIVRFLKAKGAQTLLEIVEMIEKSEVKRDPKASVLNNVRWYLGNLSKKGLVESSRS